MTLLFPRLRRSALLFAIAITLLITGCRLFERPKNVHSEVRSVYSLEGQIGEPFGIAALGGDLYVSDGQKGVIWRFDAGGNIDEFARDLKTPSHIAFGTNGVLYVADSGDHTIKAIDASGTVTILAGVKGKRGFEDGPGGSALFNAPIGIACLDDKVFVADTYNDVIRVIENNSVRTLAGGKKGFSDNAVGSEARFDTPTGLAVTGGTLLVADTGNKRIRAVTLEGSATTIAGGGQGSDPDGIVSEAWFTAPVGIAVDESGTVFVADGDSIRAIGRRFIPVVETISGKTRGFSDGNLKQARFNRVSGLAVAADGDLLASDSDNGLVRRVTGMPDESKVKREKTPGNRPSAKAFRKLGAGRWPYKPSTRPREIAGTLGEIRGEIKGDSENAWFHNGLDIVGGYGEEACMIRSEKILRPIAVGEFATKRENVRFPSLGYIHIRLGREVDGTKFNDGRFQFQKDKSGKLKDLRIPRGSEFKAGEVLGTLNTMNHVHLVAGPAGGEMNALDALLLPGAGDSSPPVIEDIDIYDRGWKALETDPAGVRIKTGEKIRIVAAAYDQMDGNADRRRLGLYKLGYQLLDSSEKPVAGFERPKWTIEFDRMPRNEAVRLVYAEGSQSGATGKTVFRYIVSNRVSGDVAMEDFADILAKEGQYILRVHAADYFGNAASKDLVLHIER